MNLLFTSSGRRVSLVRIFRNALSELNLDGRIYTADIKPDAPSAQVADKHCLVPRADDPSYVTELLGLCERHQIDLVVPLIDTELVILAANVQLFSEIGTELVISSEQVITLCRDKKKLCDHFAKYDLKCPEILDPSSIQRFPVFLKPRGGSSSVGAHRIDNQESLEFYSANIPNCMVQEFIDGEEYTVDVLVDRAGKIHCTVPRLRLETRAGEVSKGITKRRNDVIEFTNKVVNSLEGSFGCITVQCMLNDGEPYLIEVNPRFGGGFPLTVAAGANYAKHILAWYSGLQLPAIVWQDNLSMLRYDEAFFVHQ